MVRPTEQNNFIWLTAALIGMLVTGAFTDQYPDIKAMQILELSSVALMLVALRSLRENRRWFRGLLAIIGLMAVIAVARLATELEFLDFLFLGLLVVFFLSATWLVGHQVLLTGSVDNNKIIGSVALYMMMGLIYAILYTIVLEFSPEALGGIESQYWTDNLSSTTYFSFVTLTTLGYGDISPLTRVAEVIVILESITGLFYLAIIVASLVGSKRRH